LIFGRLCRVFWQIEAVVIRKVSQPQFIMLNNRFLVPVIVATAFHALVFVGADSSNPPPPVGPEPVAPTLPPVPTRMIEIALEPTEETEPRDAVATQRRGSDRVFLPQQDDPPVLRDGWGIKPEPIHPGPVSITTRIPTEVWGDPNGDGDELTSRAVISFTSLDNPPRTRSQVAPLYPAAAKTSGLTGEVLVEFVVDEQGRVIRARVVKSSNSIFDLPTLKAVERWRFEPGKKTGQPVRFRMVAPVVFSLDA
jgi:protein TonB